VTDGFVLDEQGRKMSKSMGNVTAPQEVNDKYGADILRLWVMNSDTSEDLRIGPEILKQQAELYRRLRNTLRWILGSLDGFTDAEKLPLDELPELEKWILNQLWIANRDILKAVDTHDWTEARRPGEVIHSQFNAPSGVYPGISYFCSADLSGFYFDIRKDVLYCDRPDSLRRRACRTVLDILHRHLCTWLAPVLPFTAEEAWITRFGGDSSIHLEQFPIVPANWEDAQLAKKWWQIRMLRGRITREIEERRKSKEIGSSLEVNVSMHQALNVDNGVPLLSDEEWATVCIVSRFVTHDSGELSAISVTKALGTKCERCWRVLEEVGTIPAHPTLCIRCCEAVEA
jgi:isoleucyl-tRNA synthetase